MLILLAHVARASGGYPAEIQSYLGLSCAPQCTICHEDNGGGNGTVVQPFGAAMMDRGLTGGSQYDLLHAALDAVATDGVDSDGDGLTDTDALGEGIDPNTGAAFCDVLTPTYGCATGGVGAGVGAIGGALFGLAVRRRSAMAG